MNSSKLFIISETAGMGLYSSAGSSEHIATIFPIPALYADSIPDIASSTTMQSFGASSIFFAAIW